MKNKKNKYICIYYIGTDTNYVHVRIIKNK